MWRRFFRKSFPIIDNHLRQSQARASRQMGYARNIESGCEGVEVEKLFFAPKVESGEPFLAVCELAVRDGGLRQAFPRRLVLPHLEARSLTERHLLAVANHLWQSIGMEVVKAPKRRLAASLTVHQLHQFAIPAVEGIIPDLGGEKWVPGLKLEPHSGAIQSLQVGSVHCFQALVPHKIPQRLA